MAETAETPKKFVESDLKCFTCSLRCTANEKIFIFGKSAANFAEIIQSALNININCYDNSDLFICKRLCYKRLLKFQRATDNLQEIKKEIEEAFKAREKPRAKRLLRREDGKPDEAPLLVGPGNPRSKASKSLQFGTEASTSTTCTSSNSNSQPMSDVARPLTYFPGLLSPIEMHPYRLVLNAFPNQHGTQMTSSPLVSGSHFRPGLTSTPSSSNCDQVKLSVQYPSKNVNKTLHGTYQAIGKALAHGVPSRIAGAIMNCKSVRNHVVEKVMKIVSKEVSDLCSKRNPSLLRKTEKADLEKFDLELVCNEWKERAPIFYSFLLTSAVNKTTKASTWFASLALAGSVLLKQRNSEMSASAAVIGILLKSKSIEVWYQHVFIVYKMKTMRFVGLDLILFYFTRLCFGTRTGKGQNSILFNNYKL